MNMRQIINLVEETVTAYHGSQVSQPEFKMGHTGNNSHTFGAYTSTRWGVFFTNNPDFARMYGEVGQYTLNLSNTLNLGTDNGNTLYYFIQTLDAHDPQERPIWLEAMAVWRGRDARYWQAFEEEVGERFVAYLKEQGYDSATFYETNEDDHGNEVESQTIVVFDPSKISRIVEGASQHSGNAEVLDEVNTLRHDETDDAQMDDHLERSYRIQSEPWRGELQRLGFVGNLEVTAVWPMNFRSFFFFFDNWGNKAGMATLKQYQIEGVTNVYSIDLVYLKPKFRKQGTGLAFYQFLLDRGVRLLSDRDQTAGSQGLWARLAKTPGYEVWTVEDDKVIRKVTDTSVSVGTSLRLIARKAP
jgi:ADP-Ribosyltransferase in polyvalent proteins